MRAEQSKVVLREVRSGEACSMGHQLLGTLPRSRLWTEVVQLIEDNAEVDVVSAAVSRAAEQSMIDAGQDATVQHAFYLVAKIPLAARAQDFQGAMAGIGITVPNAPTLTDVVSGMMEAIDEG